MKFVNCLLWGISLAIAFGASAREVEPFLKHSNSWDVETKGCELEGIQYPTGELIAMNRKAIQQHEENGGYVSDGEAVMMQCAYLVDVEQSDHPRAADRIYRWVAFSWGNF